MEEFTIGNWKIFSTYWVSVEIYKIQKQDGVFVYNPTLTFSLDEFKGEETPDIEDQKVISITCDRFFTDSKIAATFAVQNVKDLFANLSAKVHVYDNKHELVEEFDINDFIEEEVNNELT